MNDTPYSTKATGPSEKAKRTSKDIYLFLPEVYRGMTVGTHRISIAV
jgi:hypothetical protein